MRYTSRIYTRGSGVRLVRYDEPFSSGLLAEDCIWRATVALPEDRSRQQPFELRGQVLSLDEMAGHAVSRGSTLQASRFNAVP